MNSSVTLDDCVYLVVVILEILTASFVLYVKPWFVLTASIGSSSLMTSFTPDQALQEDSSKPPKRPKIEGWHA